MNETTQRKLIAVRYSGGLEGSLDLVAWFFFCLGILAAVLVFAIGTPSFGWFAVLTAFETLVGAIVGWLLFRSLAEVIRLLKKQAGLNYGGKITTPDEHVDYACVACNSRLYDDFVCHACGRKIVDNETSGESP